jgi:nucleoid-associated protein YgaU
MITVFSPDHVLRSARTELYGGELVRPHESPERAQIVLERVQAETPKQNPSSGGLSGNRAHVVSEGDSLHSIAFREYDDPALWRGLADLNGIDDPMRLRAGQRLIVPPFEQAAARS